VRSSERDTAAIESLPTVHGYREFSALLWATNCRSYSMSAGLSAAVSSSAPSPSTSSRIRDWVLLGTASGIDPGMYEGRLARDLAQYLRRSPNQRRPPPDALPPDERPVVHGDL